MLSMCYSRLNRKTGELFLNGGEGVVTRREFLKSAIILPTAATIHIPLSWTEQPWIQKLKRHGYLYKERIIVTEKTYLPPFSWVIVGCYFKLVTPESILCLPDPKWNWCFAFNICMSNINIKE